MHVAFVRAIEAGFEKDDFKVQLDAGGRLTVRGERPAGHVRFHKSLQLPPTANLDGVSGRFDGKVLSLAVPKKAAARGVAEMVVARMAEAECAAAAREEEDEAGGGFK
jgi:HSP20 family molecular chaperone IbpA